MDFKVLKFGKIAWREIFHFHNFSNVLYENFELIPVRMDLSRILKASQKLGKSVINSLFTI